MVQRQFNNYKNIVETLEDEDLMYCPEIPQEIIDLKQAREIKNLSGKNGSKKFGKSYISVNKIFDSDT